MSLYRSQNFKYLLFNSPYLSLLKSFSVQYTTKQKSREKTDIKNSPSGLTFSRTRIMWLIQVAVLDVIFRTRVQAAILPGFPNTRKQ